MCEHCGEPFTSYRRFQRFCSERCQVRARNARITAARRAAREAIGRLCPCGEPLGGRKSGAKFCSPACENRINMRRRLGIDIRLPLERPCWWCDEPFKSPDLRRQYCSKDCWNLVRHMANNVPSKYGITRDDYRRLWRGQGGLCAICRQPERSSRNRLLAVDHSHTTGRVRGLLCSHCNRAIGLFDDNPATLTQAVEYLTERLNAAQRKAG